MISSCLSVGCLMCLRMCSSGAKLGRGLAPRNVRHSHAPRLSQRKSSTLTKQRNGVNEWSSDNNSNNYNYKRTTPRQLHPPVPLTTDRSPPPPPPPLPSSFLGSQDQSVIWNFPIDVTFKATNAFGWPRLALSVYGVDGMGRDVVRGYGSLLMPTSPGTHVKYVHMYRPINSSILQRFMAWVTGTHPEVSMRAR